MNVADLIQGATEWSRRLARENDFKPDDPSPALQELARAEPRGLAPLVSGNYFIGQRHLQASAGHADAFVRLIGFVAGAYGQQALVRSALESASRVRWLFDFQIDWTERAARGLADRHKSLQELRKLTHEPAEIAALNGRLQSMESFARQSGLPLRPRPSATDLIEDLFDVSGVGAPNFRQLSFAIHGQEHGVIAEMALNEPEARLEAVLRDDIPAASAAHLGILLFLGMINAIDAQWVFFGWEGSEWIQWRRAATAELKSLRER